MLRLLRVDNLGSVQIWDYRVGGFWHRDLEERHQRRKTLALIENLGDFAPHDPRAQSPEMPKQAQADRLSEIISA